MIKYIIIVILIILILNNLKTKENFTTSTFDAKAYLENKIDNYYNNKIKNINNILDFVTSYNNNNNNINIISDTPINSNNIIVNKDTEIKGYNKLNNLIVNGNLTISDDLIIDDYRNDTYNKNIEIIPRYMIIAWHSKYKYNSEKIPIELDIPKGWVICDGKKYVYINNKFEELNSESEYTGEIIETPNLIDKFIIGASEESFEWTSIVDGNGNKNTKQNTPIRTLYSYGGINNYVFKKTDLPPHIHNFMIGPKIVEDQNKKSYGVYSHMNSGTGMPIKTKLDYYGRATPLPVNIKPPYYSLYYIMKL